MHSPRSPGPDVRNVPASSPATDDLGGLRLVLRDGSVASVRIAGQEDLDAIRRFFHRLSQESRQKRFFSAADPSDSLIDRVSESSADRRDLTLVVSRHVDGEDCLVAVATYIAITNVAAEVAFAVDDRFHGKGLATLLLEQLAAFAAGRGFQSFHATTLGDNTAMLDVFRDSGFEIRARSKAGVVDLQLSISPSSESVASLNDAGSSQPSNRYGQCSRRVRSPSSEPRATPPRWGRGSWQACDRRGSPGRSILSTRVPVKSADCPHFDPLAICRPPPIWRSSLCRQTRSLPR